MKRWIHASSVLQNNEVAKIRDFIDNNINSVWAVNETTSGGVSYILAEKFSEDSAAWEVDDITQYLRNRDINWKVESYYSGDNGTDIKPFKIAITVGPKELKARAAKAAKSVDAADDSAKKTIPDGYLTTTAFTTRSIDTDDKRNALEALEVAIAEKFEQFDKMCDITFNLTSGQGWMGTIEEYPEGYYIKLDGTRSSFQAFVEYPSCNVIRKPRSLSPMIRSYSVNGEAGQVYKMREDRR